MSEFLVMYSGATVNSSEIVAITANPSVVRDFARRMLDEPAPRKTTPAASSIEGGRRGALELVRDAPA